ncbi:MAG: glycosyltransferase family 39 protein [Candidatus Diapherotrites archaeon]|nr:glycosyltransferase family 39 protein [Candidatus Diapherotrites archaeon]
MHLLFLEKSLRKETLGIAGIFIFAFIIRAYDLSNIPKGLYLDEASNGYNSYKILKTGRDEWGVQIPLYFKAFGEYKNPVFIYGSLPFVAFFGLSAFSVRLASAFFGTLAVIATFFLVRKIFGLKEAAIASLLLAVSPWHFVLSRIAFEVITLPTFFLLGLFFLIIAADNKKLYLILSAACFALAVYSYKIAYAFIPFFLLSFFIIYRKRFSIGKIVFFASILALLLLPLFAEFAFNEEHRNATNQKNMQFSIFNESFTKEKESKGISKEQAIFELYLENYASYFSIDFLFIKGDRLPRHSVPEKGQLYFFYIPLLAVGSMICIFMRTEAHKLMLFWLISWPVVAAFSADYSPHALRSITAIPVFEIICALAIAAILDEPKKWRSEKIKSFALFAIISIFAITEVAFFMHTYFVEYPQKAALYFNCGYEEAFMFTEQEKPKYEKVYIASEVFSYNAHILALFFLRLDSEKLYYEGALGNGYEMAISTDENDLEKPSLFVFRHPAKKGIPVKTIICAGKPVLEISEIK